MLLTDNVDGCQIEAGPDSFLTEKPWAHDLCRELGLGDQLIGSNDEDRQTYILVKGKLVSIPEGLNVHGSHQGAPGVALAGNAYHGIGVPDCIRSGTEAAGKVLTGLTLLPNS